MNTDRRFELAIRAFWASRERQLEAQVARGKTDVGSRGAVTGGTQMSALESLLIGVLENSGIPRASIYNRRAVELPGYFRPEKKWDLLAVVDGQLVAAMEFKSHIGPSFGNNTNNRTEEAIGSASDIWTAYREGLLGTYRPWLGYFILLEDCPAVNRAVRSSEPHFKIDPDFNGATYARRYEVMLRRLVLERLYDSACLTLCARARKAKPWHPADDLSFHRFVSDLRAAASRAV